MHTLTKGLVVFCAIFCVALSALTMTFASNVDAVKNELSDSKDHIAALKAANDAASASLAQERLTLLEEAQEAQRVARELRTQKSQLELRMKDIEAEKVSAVIARDSGATRFDALTAQNKQLTDIVAVLRDETEAIRTDLLTANKREIELVDRINVLEGNAEVLEQNARALREQLEEANYQLQIARTSTAGVLSGESTGASTADYVIARTPIRCEVADVFKSPAGYDMVTITEGSNGGVQEKMKMNIVSPNGDDFIGNLIVVVVEPQQAVGRIDYLGRNTEASIGDSVFSALD